VLTSYFLFVELKQLMYTGAKYLLRL